MMLTEYVMQHLAAASGIHIDKLRVKNWYQDGMTTHFGQKLSAFIVPRIFDNMQESAEHCGQERKPAAFNAENKWKKRGSSTAYQIRHQLYGQVFNQGGALVHVYTDGTVLISHGGTGDGPRLAHQDGASCSAMLRDLSLSRVMS